MRRSEPHLRYFLSLGKNKRRSEARIAAAALHWTTLWGRRRAGPGCMSSLLWSCASGRRGDAGARTRGAVRRGGGTQPGRADSWCGEAATVGLAARTRGAVVARAGHGVVQSESRSLSNGITRSGASSGITVIDLRIRRWVYEQQHCCLFLIYRQHGYTISFIWDRGTIGIKFPSEHGHVTLMTIKETNCLNEWQLGK
jgi:hypothetical protein